MHISPLKQEALAIVEQLELFTLLAPYGHAELVGSVVLDLIVKRDIDIHIIAKNPALITQATQLAGLFLENPAITTIRISPYRTMPHGAQALHLALDNISGPSGLWSIDLWLATDKAITGIEKTKYLQEILTPAQRTIIMHIKTALNQKKLLSQGMSTKIYYAVVEHGVTTPQSFFAYLKQTAQK